MDSKLTQIAVVSDIFKIQLLQIAFRAFFIYPYVLWNLEWVICANIFLKFYYIYFLLFLLTDFFVEIILLSDIQSTHYLLLYFLLAITFMNHL